VHVLWGASDIIHLITRAFPERLEFYRKALVTPVERSDYARMLILHSIGGVYIDIDMECLQDVFLHIDPSKSVQLMRSPLFTETFQSCMLISNEKNNSFWLDTADRIERNIKMFCGPSPLCANGAFIRSLLCAPFLGSIVRCALTVFLTGPSNLDKTIAADLGLSLNWQSIGVLDDRFYNGDVALHHESGSWTPVAPWVDWCTWLKRAVAKAWSIFTCNSSMRRAL
jgi:hypothetical protein